MKEKFTSTNTQMEEFNVYKTLFQMDAGKYTQTMKDFSTSSNNQAYPIWSNLDFLQRADNNNNGGDPLKQLKAEIMRLRYENKDFAAELEKAQNLLQLQRDIERDNTQYFETEKQRLLLTAKSTTLKAEEMARRADEKQRQLNEVVRKVGSPERKEGGATQNRDVDVMSEFSVMTNESEVRTDENVMDFVVMDGEYVWDGIKQVMDERELHSKTLITFVTVDFYNHDTETSQMAEGFRPLYNTQFSFKNKVDDFYVHFLQKSTLKMDVYISKNNAAVHIGSAEVFLREVVEREVAGDPRPPVIQKTVRVMSVAGNVPIGSLRFKMRMRRPISEAVRYFREKNEIANVKSVTDAGSRRKLITVQVVAGKDLKVKYGQIAHIQPFFYYQFYTFEERYSSTGQGPNPVFEDTQNYEVVFDAKLVDYLSRQPLELILFDDNAPVTGIDRMS